MVRQAIEYPIPFPQMVLPDYRRIGFHVAMRSPSAPVQSPGHPWGLCHGSDLFG